jgi:class 3 adenylate cyclase
MSHTFLFADLCGFTEYTWNHGDVRAVELAVGFHARVRELAREEGCELVKPIGDAVMLRAADCRAALRLARRVIALADAGYPPIRVGVDTGPAVEHEGDWYGCTVNTAARMAGAAGPGELVVSERAHAALAHDREVPLRAHGVWSLKGLPAMRVHAAVTTSAHAAVTTSAA